MSDDEMEIEYAPGRRARGRPETLARFAHHLGRLDAAGHTPARSGDERSERHLSGIPPVQSLTPSPPSESTLLHAIKVLATSKAMGWVKEHPTGGVAEFTQAMLGVRITGATHGEVLARRAYNKLAHARRMAKVPPPSKAVSP